MIHLSGTRPDGEDNSSDSLSSSTSLSTSSDDNNSRSTILKVEDKVNEMVSGGFNKNNNIGVNSVGTDKFFGPKVTKQGDDKNKGQNAANQKTKMFMEASKELPFDQLPPKVQKFKKLEKFAKLMHLKNNLGNILHLALFHI